MNTKNNPAIQPGEGARAIDTFRLYSNTGEDFTQAFAAVKKFLIKDYGAEGKEGYYEGFTSAISYLSGYARNMPIHIAFSGVRKILSERYGLENE